MCWVLTNNGSRQRLRLRPGTVLVGRAQNAHIKPNHQSVSRNHAEIIVEGVPPQDSIQEVRPYKIFLKDLSSTGHTFVNGEPSGKGILRPLTNDDTVAFGVDPENFSLQWCPTVFSCSSSMKPEEKEKVNGLVRQAGAFLAWDWVSTCTHLLMDKLAITPKLLNCIVDGAVPVGSSFLDALATCELAGKDPDPMLHQPRPATGADAVYAMELINCTRSPKSRRDLLRGVWIIFEPGAKESVPLKNPLSSAGAGMQFCCDDVAQLKTSLAQTKAARGPPEEVWVVPGLQTDFADALASSLLALGAKQCLAVPVQAMVFGILKGHRSAVLDGTNCASHIALSKASQGSYAETQQPRQVLRPAMAAKALDAKDGVKDETFPHTQEQPGMPPMPQKRAEVETRGAADVTAKRQRIAPVGTEAFHPIAVKFSSTQDLQQKLDVPTLGMAQTVSTCGRPKSENGLGQRVPLTVASTDGGVKPTLSGLKQDVEKLKVEADGVPMSVVSSCGGPSTQPTPEGSGMPKILSINFDTPMTQPKPEDNKDFIADSIAKLEMKPKDEIAPPPPQTPSGSAANAFPSTAGGGPVARTEQAHEAVKHPNGVWLEKKSVGEQKQEPCVVEIQGMGAKDIHSFRPLTQKGAVTPTPARTGMVAASAAGREERASAAVNGVNRNFKMFRKAMGQQKVVEREVVPISPWAPAPGPGLAEVFASHRLDADSQLPPL